MLTDIFARRYENVSIWTTFDEPSRRLITQGHQLLEQLFPYYVSGKESEEGKRNWTNLHSLMARELGLRELSPLVWGYWNPSKQWIGGSNPIHKVCETWMLQQFDGSLSADRFIKERLSLVEIGFRIREKEVAHANAELPRKIAEAKELKSPQIRLQASLRLPGSRVDSVKALNASMNAIWQAAVDELNARFRHAECGLHYHNGFIQMELDETLTQLAEAPFWKLVADPKWKNVDHDMKEAVDLRDTSGRDPAFYGAKALESAIKIISDEKQLSNGKERGAAAYIENLKRGNLIEGWEAEALKAFFSKVRNPLGHGPGTGTMPSLNAQQTDWAIETCMIWAKSLIRRI
jgi:hypothetical protein